MRRQSAISIGFACMVALAACHEPTSQQAPARETESPDDALARLQRELAGTYTIVLRDRPAMTGPAAKSLLKPFGLVALRVYPGTRVFTARLSEAQIATLRADPRVESVEADQLALPRAVTLQATSSWGLDGVQGMRDGYFAYSETGSAVHLYMLDGPIRRTHSEFTGRATLFNDPIGVGSTCYTAHGTATASLAAGATLGVAKGVPIYSVQILDCTEHGSTSAMVAGLDYVAAHRALPAALNMSVGVSCGGSANPNPPITHPLSGGACDGTNSQVDAAVASAVSAGVTVVVAAGNTNTDACNNTPGRDPGAIVVGAIDSTMHPWFETSGAYQGDGTDYGSCVTLFAPGAQILAADPSSDVATTTIFGGTSLSAPFAAGTAVLYLQNHPTATPPQVKTALLAAARVNAIAGLGSTSPNKLLQYVFTPIAVSMSGPTYADHQNVTITAAAGQSGTFWYSWSYQYCGASTGPEGTCSGTIYPANAGWGASSNTTYLVGDKWTRFTVQIWQTGANLVLGSAKFDVGGPTSQQ